MTQQEAFPAPDIVAHDQGTTCKASPVRRWALRGLLRNEGPSAVASLFVWTQREQRRMERLERELTIPTIFAVCKECHRIG